MSLPVIEFNINLSSPLSSGRTLTVPVRSAFTLTATIKDVDGQLMDLEGYTFQFRAFSRTVAWSYMRGHDVMAPTTRASFDIPDDALDLVGNLRYGFEVINPDGSLFVQNIGEIRVLARDDVGVTPPPPPPATIVNSVDGEAGDVDLSGSYLGIDAQAADVDPEGEEISKALEAKGDAPDAIAVEGATTVIYVRDGTLNGLPRYTAGGGRFIFNADEDTPTWWITSPDFQNPPEYFTAQGADTQPTPYDSVWSVGAGNAPAPTVRRATPDETYVKVTELAAKVNEAPADGQAYIRKDEAWAVLTGLLVPITAPDGTVWAISISNAGNLDTHATTLGIPAPTLYQLTAPGGSVWTVSITDSGNLTTLEN